MSYSPTDKPTVPQLCEELSSITEWENFVTFLPGIEAEHIGTIRNDHQGTANQRRAVFQKWLEIYPDATWSDVYDALMKVEKKSLASSLVKARNQSVSDTDSSPMSLPQTPPSQQPHPPATPVEHLQTASIFIQDDIGDSLLELYEMFMQIIYQVKTKFATFVTQQPAQLKNIIRFTEDAINPSQMIRLEAESIEEYFEKLRPYYDFLECGIIANIVKQFIGGKLEENLQAYSAKVREFRRTTPIKQLAKDLCQIATGFKALPTIDIKLETPWEDVVIEGLYVLIKHLLPKTAQSQYSLMNNIIISPGCLLLKYGIGDEGQIDTIIEHVQQNMHFLIGLFGIFQLSVDGKYVIFEDEDPSFSFTTALIDATKASNNTAIQFLLDIGTNINYQDDEGFTPLMWAVLINNVNTVIQLLESGADVHIIQRKYHSITVLMLACMGNKSVPPPGIQRLSDDYSDTIRVLLSYGADPLARMDNGYGMLLSSFDEACGLNNSDIVEILLTDHSIPPEAVANGLYWALLQNSTNAIKLLQSKLPDVDPLAITLGVLCAQGDKETVKSLMKQGVDPSTDIVHGLTPLMIASNHGYIDVVDILLQHGANVNMVNVHEHSALDFAKRNDGIVQLLQQNGALYGTDIKQTEECHDASTDTHSSSEHGRPLFRSVGKFGKLIASCTQKEKKKIQVATHSDILSTIKEKEKDPVTSDSESTTL